MLCYTQCPFRLVPSLLLLPYKQCCAIPSAPSGSSHHYCCFHTNNAVLYPVPLQARPIATVASIQTMLCYTQCPFRLVPSLLLLPYKQCCAIPSAPSGSSHRYCCFHTNNAVLYPVPLQARPVALCIALAYVITRLICYT